MDLLQTVRKEGTRGGRAEFKWEDVKDSQHRENYLGHSLMAPVGRWQQGRDLNWYARADDGDQTEADRRKEELRRVKQAEEDAMARALGLEPPQRAENNANLTEVAAGRDVGRAGVDNGPGEKSDQGQARRRQGPEPEPARREGRHHHHHHHRRRSTSRERRHGRHDDGRDRRRDEQHRTRDRRRRSKSRSNSRSRDDGRRSRSRERPGRSDRHDRYDRHDTRDRRDRRTSQDRRSRRERSRSPNERRRR